MISLSICNAAFIEQQAKTEGQKVPHMYMQILEWCIAIDTINGFETPHEFIEEEKCPSECFSVAIIVASLQTLLV